jgi:hypothetical protein
MRSALLFSYRLEVPLDSERSSLEWERFQNICLRPILKFQHDALVLYFRSQVGLGELPPKEKEREAFITQKLQKDILTRHTLIGMVLGLMSEEELAYYLRNNSELSRRLVGMLVQRLSEGVVR